MDNVFDLSKVILGGLVHDSEIGIWISKISYGTVQDNLMIQLPLMEVQTMKLSNNGLNSRIKIYLKVVNDGSTKLNNFIRTVNDIELTIKNKILKYFKQREVEEFFVQCTTDNLNYTFYVPIFENSLTVAVLNNKNEILSLKELKKGSVVTGTLYVSHVEVEQESFFLNWNIIQIKLE